MSARLTATFGMVFEHAWGLECADCGSDAHIGACNEWTCATCGVECGQSGCSLHDGRPNLHRIPRRPLPKSPGRLPDQDS